MTEGIAEVSRMRPAEHRRQLIGPLIQALGHRVDCFRVTPLVDGGLIRGTHLSLHSGTNRTTHRATTCWFPFRCSMRYGVMGYCRRRKSTYPRACDWVGKLSRSCQSARA